MPAVVYALRKGLILIFSETTNAISFKIEQGITLDSLYILSGKRRHQLLPVGSKSPKPIHFGSSSDRDFWIMLQPIQKKFAELETVIQGIHFLQRKTGAPVDLPSFAFPRYVDG